MHVAVFNRSSLIGSALRLILSLAKTPDSLHPTLDSFDSTIENFRSGRNEELACDIIYAHIECAGSELYHGDMFT